MDNMYDAIPHWFQWVIQVLHPTFYSSHDGNRSVETVSAHTNVYDDLKKKKCI